MTDLAVSAPLRPMPQPLLHTDWPATLLMAGLVAACVAGGWWWASRREGARSSPKSSRGHLTPDDWALLQQCVKEGEVGIKGLFTSEERQIFRQLRQAFPEWTILAKVPLSSVTEPLRPDWAPLWQRGLMHIHLDFALFSPNGRLLAAIECAGPSQATRWPDWLPKLLEQLRVRHLVLTKGRPCTVLDLRRLLLTPDPKLDEWPVVPESLWGPFKEEAMRQLEQPSPAMALRERSIPRPAVVAPQAATDHASSAPAPLPSARAPGQASAPRSGGASPSGSYGQASVLH